MKKILSFFLQFILLLQFFLFLPQNAQAANCTFTITPSQVTTNERTININIKTQGLVEGKNYNATFNPGTVYFVFDQSASHQASFKISNGEINIQNLNANGYVNPIPNNKTAFEAKIYTIGITEPNTGRNNLCMQSFTVTKANSGGTCNISYINTSFTTGDDIQIKADNLAGNPTDQRKVVLKRNNESGSEISVPNDCVSVNQLASSGINLGKHESGQYYTEIRDSCFPAFYNRLCYSSFAIGIPGQAGGGFLKPGPIATPNPSLSPLCPNDECSTALGPLSTNPTKFVKNIFGILLSLAGGFALVLIMISGYRLMVSEGNPEKVQAAREQLTSAIVGLLFVIFSITILQIIGVNILKIPGFQ